jgi:GNAT superfamily N-acetyltransferase
MEDWCDVMRPQLEKILARPYVTAVIAYEDSDPAFVYGYLVTEADEKPPLVYWVYVKAPYRKQGIARQLFQAAGVNPFAPFDYVCSTPIVTRLSTSGRWDPLRGRYSRDHRKNAR